MGTSEGLAGANTSNPGRLRERLSDLLGVDRWIEADFPAVAPAGEAEAVKLLEKYPGEVMVIGQGTSFPADFTPPTDALIVLTSRLIERFTYSREDQVVDVSAGWSVSVARARLAAQGMLVPALERFSNGTIGGRLAGISARNTGGRDGWTQSLLGLTVALPDGERLTLGGRCIKDVAGYDLRFLFTGSRGNLGIILNAIFRCRTQSEWNANDYPVTQLKSAGRISPLFRKVLDPKSRMRSGI